MTKALIALGGNVGDVRTTFDRAVALLCAADEVRLLARSSDYRTPPWGVEDQPPFINSCLLVDTRLSPRKLLALAQRIETTLGRDRTRERRWGPRPIDIDLIDYENVSIDEADLQLPHPHVLERIFVLVPLGEIAPGWTIRGTTIHEALCRIRASGTIIGASGIEILPTRRRHV